MTTCIHGKPLHVECLVCKAESVRDAIERSIRETLDAPRRPPVHMVTRFYKVPHPRAVAIVALRRIVDRAVSDTVGSPTIDDILRIALKALNQLEE